MIFPRLIMDLFDSPERKRCNMRRRIYNMRLGDIAEGHRYSMCEIRRQQQKFYRG